MNAAPWPAALLALLAVGPAWAVDPPGQVGDLLITELMTEPTVVPDYYGEWFELYNNSGKLLDLGGLVIQDDDGEELTISSSDPKRFLNAGDYLVLGVSTDTSKNGNVTVDIAYDFVNFKLDKTGDELRVSYGSLTLDEVAWDSAWGFGSSSAASQLSPSVLLEWGNDHAVNWCDASTYISPKGVYGTPGAVNVACPTDAVDSDGDGFTRAEGDCDDSDAEVNPRVVDGDGAPYSALDDDADCDGTRDDGTTDDDGDGWTEEQGDCDDEDVLLSPNRSEGKTPDGVDNDCNCWVDDLDLDGDGYTTQDDSTTDPTAFGGVEAVRALYCGVNDDCDDTRASVSPEGTEVAYDGLDNDCVDGDLCDVDGDGYDAAECGADDCDDSDASVRPGVSDADIAPDGVDNDCDGQIDAPDQDGDGYDVAGGDCDDADPTISPAGEERCDDRRDEDCDGFINEGCEVPALVGGARGDTLFCATLPPPAGHPSHAPLGLAATLSLLLALARRR